MAKSIQATPKLSIEETEKFLRRVERDLKKKVGLAPTPKLINAEKIITEYAAHRAQHDM